MLRIFLLISILSQTFTLFSQTRYGYLLNDSSLLSLTSISNTLYAGIDNRFAFNTTKINNYDTILLKANNGVVLFDSTYFVIPNRPGNLRIELHGIIDNAVDTIGFYNFRVLRLPSPKIALENVIIENNIEVSVNKFINSDSLQIIITPDIPDSKNWIQIKEFSIGYNYGGHYIGATSNSSFITSEMKNIVRTNGVGHIFSVKVITQSATSLLLTNPIYKVIFY